MAAERGNALPEDQAAASPARVDYLVLPETGATARLSIHTVCINTMWYIEAHNCHIRQTKSMFAADLAINCQ